MFVAAIACSTACVTTVGNGDDLDCSDGRCDTVDQTCTDTRYGDGVCQTQIDCQVPDIDCFRTFASDAEAAAWYSDFEAQSAAQTGGAPRTLLDASDARFAHVRELADKGWQAFSKARPVGRLAAQRPGVVLIDDASPNAFVAPDLASGKAGFSIQVQTGLLSLGASDDALLGVMMHELQHAVGLHVVGDTRDRLRKFYTATDYSEPIGRLADDDPTARAAGTAWRYAGEDAGDDSAAELGGLPLGGNLLGLLGFAMNKAAETNNAGCSAAGDTFNALYNDIESRRDPLSGVAALDATISGRADNLIAALRDQCFTGVSLSFIDAVAAMVGATPADIVAGTSPEDLALVQNKPVLDGVVALTLTRRAEMRRQEQSFASTAGQPWERLRYFSIEEDADDTSVLVLRDAGLEPAGEADFMLRFLGDQQARCQSIIDAGDVPPYGAALTDEHHGTCWRAYHLIAWREASAAQQPGHTARRAPTATTATRRLPIPRRLKDVVVY